jgi:yecA family protein
MGWMDCHLHEFTIKDPITSEKVRLSIPADDELDDLEPFIPCWEYKIAPFFTTENPRANYLYDFGDCWKHIVRLEGIFQRDKEINYPICIGGKRAAPPEDCGGLTGYANILEGKGEEYAEYFQDFDPEHFSTDQVIFDDPDMRWRVAFLDEEFPQDMLPEEIHGNMQEFLQTTNIKCQELEKLLLEFNQKTLPVAQIHGMISAIVCGPKPVSLNTWLPYVFQNRQVPEFSSKKEAKLLIGKLVEMNNDISNSLLDEMFLPYFGNNTLAFGEIPDPVPWCLGFQNGMSFAAELWLKDKDTDFGRLLLPILFHLKPDDFSDQLKKIPKDEIPLFTTNLIIKIPWAVQELQNYWRENAPQMPSPVDPFGAPKQKPHLRLVKKIGRNELCPCGSGKKYKQCCLNKA